mmetsp:Transcript_21690/g.45629  ORF Transcript_21690/g.45629 Transcript_21690/m.45629 type:complete len:349 (+) Transcript_21690:109-1155(+)
MMPENETEAPFLRKNSGCSDEQATDMIKMGLADAVQREKTRKAEMNRVPIDRRQEAISENFPNVQGEKLITKMSESDLMALRLEAYYSEKKRMKEMFKKVQEQISEYHELLEYSNKMESCLEKLRGRARSLEDECKAKSLKVAQLEKEVVDLKLNLATEKSSSDRISNELAKVQSENQILVKTISMQSLGYSSTCSGRRTSSMAARKNTSSGNVDQFSLFRPQPKQPRGMKIENSSEPAVDEIGKPRPVSDLMNLTVSWMNSHKWGSAASLATEQQTSRVSNADIPTRAEKSDAAATTAVISNVSMISTLESGIPDGLRNADWNVIQPMNASSNPLLRQLNSTAPNAA